MADLNKLPPLTGPVGGPVGSLSAQAAALGQPGLMSQVASGLFDQLKTSVRAIPHLPAAITKGWNDPDASPEENSLRRRAVADAAMTLVSAGWGKLVTSVGMEGLPLVLRTLVQNPVASSAAENALASMGYEAVDKGDKADYLGAAAGGAIFGGVAGGLAAKLFGHGAAVAEKAANKLPPLLEDLSKSTPGATGGTLVSSVTRPRRIDPGQRATVEAAIQSAIAKKNPERVDRLRQYLDNTVVGMSDASEQKSAVSLMADTGPRSETFEKKHDLATALMKAHSVAVDNSAEKYAFASRILGKNVASLRGLSDDEMNDFIRKMGTGIVPRDLKANLTPTHLRMYQRWFGDKPVVVKPAAGQVVAPVEPAAPKLTSPRERAASAMVEFPANRKATFMWGNVRHNAVWPDDGMHQRLYSIGAGRAKKMASSQVQQLLELTGTEDVEGLQAAAWQYQQIVEGISKNGGPKSVPPLPTWDEAIAVAGQNLRPAARLAEEAMSKPAAEGIKPRKRNPLAAAAKPNELLPESPAVALADQIEAGNSELAQIKQDHTKMLMEYGDLKRAQGGALTPAQAAEWETKHDAFTKMEAKAQIKIDMLKNSPPPSTGTPAQELQEFLGKKTPAKVASVFKGPARGSVDRKLLNEPGFKAGGGFRLLGNSADGKTGNLLVPDGKGGLVSKAVGYGDRLGNAKLRTELYLKAKGDEVTLTRIAVAPSKLSEANIDAQATKHVQAILTKFFAKGQNIVKAGDDPRLVKILDGMVKSGYLSKVEAGYGLQEKLAEHPAFKAARGLKAVTVARNKANKKLVGAGSPAREVRKPSASELKRRGNAKLRNAGINPQTLEQASPGEALSEFLGNKPVAAPEAPNPNAAYREYHAGKMNRPPAAAAPAKVTPAPPKPSKLTPRAVAPASPANPKGVTEGMIRNAEALKQQHANKVQQMMEDIKAGKAGTQSPHFQDQLKDEQRALVAATLKLAKLIRESK